MTLQQVANKTFFSSLLFICLAQLAFGQEEIKPLYSNSALTLQAEQLKSYKKPKDTTLNLPFIEDFSTAYYYPNEKKWQDNHVFVNANFSVNAPSIGVATFDGLNHRGYPYNDQGKVRPVYCDNLTSQFIDLSSYKNADSVYLSFFFQAKGLGENPENVDSLILQFKWKKDTSNWQTVWAVNGGADTIDKPSFKEIMVWINDTGYNYFHDEFQFRFRNYGNPTGALDHWHVDYIIVDANRSINSTYINDFTLYQKPNYLTKIYTSMPFKAFEAAYNTYVSDSIKFHFNNITPEEQLPQLGYNIFDVTNNKFINHEQQRQNPTFLPGLRKTWVLETYVDITKFRYDGVILDDLKLEVELNAEAVPNDLVNTNHKYSFIQHFGNYYAYDDGTAEGGYGLEDARSGGVALKFNAVLPDTLRYLAFSFTSAKEQIASPQKFNLVVWDKILPQGSESELARITGATPIYSSVLNGWALYKLEEPIYVDGDFYIGWEQFKEYNFNVGFDRNYGDFNRNRPNPNLYFNTAGEWTRSTKIGTPLIRPIFGHEDLVSVNEKLNNQKIISFDIYPNPCNSFFSIKTSALIEKVEIYDITGRLILTQNIINEPIINVQPLINGVYTVHAIEKGCIIAIKKLIKY
ncbi:MAG: T9SS type A sorting domain-containing protein [Bacteroidetes bacterium]|nr:T9SS type A sorting domain-containing protein [Bacteroidota bacterium]